MRATHVQSTRSSHRARRAARAELRGERRRGGDDGSSSTAAGAAPLAVAAASTAQASLFCFRLALVCGRLHHPAAMLYLVAIRMPSHAIASRLEPARPHLPEA
eukprot:6212754-Pleurochrysis_carterae.AAC.1